MQKYGRHGEPWSEETWPEWSTATGPWAAAVTSKIRVKVVIIIIVVIIFGRCNNRSGRDVKEYKVYKRPKFTTGTHGNKRAESGK